MIHDVYLITRATHPFKGVFQEECLMDLKALDNGSESETCILAVGNNSPFVNLEART